NGSTGTYTITTTTAADVVIDTDAAVADDTISGAPEAPASGDQGNYCDPGSRYDPFAAGGAKCVLIPTAPAIDALKLEALTISTGTLVPAFSPGNLNYTVELPRSVTTLTVTAKADKPTAGVLIGTRAGTGTLTFAQELIQTTMDIPVVVTSPENFQRNEYRITITRPAAPVCAAGMVPSGNNCVPVPAGSYAPAGATAATQCPAGTYSNTLGSMSCTPCAAGTTSAVGATFCTVDVGVLTGAAITLSSPAAGATAVTATVTFTTPVAIPPGGKVKVQMNGVTFTSPVATFTSPSAVANTASFASGSLTLTLAAGMPGGTVTFTVTGGTNPAAQAAVTNVAMSVTDSGDTVLARTTTGTMVAITATSTPRLTALALVPTQTGFSRIEVPVADGQLVYTVDVPAHNSATRAPTYNLSATMSDPAARVVTTAFDIEFSVAGISIHSGESLTFTGTGSGGTSPTYRVNLRAAAVCAAGTFANGSGGCTACDSSALTCDCAAANCATSCASGRTLDPATRTCVVAPKLTGLAVAPVPFRLTPEDVAKVRQATLTDGQTAYELVIPAGEMYQVEAQTTEGTITYSRGGENFNAPTTSLVAPSTVTITVTATSGAT
ncbi:MAG: cadherin-like beta sandwich domain-containing protein, partial [Chloroflexota bacterium]